jgi:Right handed beta helix region
MKHEFSLPLLAGLILIALSVRSANEQPVTGNPQQYYVDSVAGNDANTGENPDRAWCTLTPFVHHVFNPGDQIHFHAEQEWKGTLELAGNGTVDAPIVVDSYGAGSPARIYGTGGPAAVLLQDGSFWTIRHLMITNHGLGEGSRNGVLVTATISGETIRGIHISDLDISNVNGLVGAGMDAKLNGGIGFYSPTRARFEDILIEHNHIHHVDSTGIWFASTPIVNPRERDWEHFHNSNLRVLSNDIEDTGRNAIFVRSAFEPVIDHNTVRHSSARHHGNAIAVFGTSRALISHNDVSLTGHPGEEGEDAALDSDYQSIGTIIEYNWSHENSGGLVNICNDPRQPGNFNDGTIVRYNLSENDGIRVFGFSGSPTNTLVYNNTVYIGKGKSPHIVDFERFVKKADGYAQHAVFVNNLIYNFGKGDYEYNGAKEIGFDSTCFIGSHPKSEPTDTRKVTGDAEAHLEGAPIQQLNQIEVYRLKANSPCARNGLDVDKRTVNDITGIPMPSPHPDRGALSSSQAVQH